MLALAAIAEGVALDRAEHGALLPGVGDEDEALHLEVDVGETTLGSRVGVVVARDDGEGWRRVLDRVERQALCTAEEKAALLAWPRISHLKFTRRESGLGT